MNLSLSSALYCMVVCCNFHEMVQCYRQMLRIVVTLRINFLHLVTSLQTALVTRCSLQRCYITVLCYILYMFPPLNDLSRVVFFCSYLYLKKNKKLYLLSGSLVWTRPQLFCVLNLLNCSFSKFSPKISA